jgi:hypothetical protein
MIRYLRHSDIAVRLNLNPFHWTWLPSLGHDKPSPFFPSRHTFVVAWLAIQVFLDIDNGVTDFKKFETAALSALGMDIEVNDTEHESEVGQKVSSSSKRSGILE